MNGLRSIIVLGLCASGCSFVGIRAPRTTDRQNPRATHCTDSALVPGLDALGGAAVLAAIGTGIVIENTSDTGRAEHFELYYAAPLLAVAIVYFSSASFGTNRVEQCQELKAAAIAIEPVTPIEYKPPPEIEITP